jgi:hypothetical protein
MCFCTKANLCFSLWIPRIWSNWTTRKHDDHANNSIIASLYYCTTKPRKDPSVRTMDSKFVFVKSVPVWFWFFGRTAHLAFVPFLGGHLRQFNVRPLSQYQKPLETTMTSSESFSFKRRKL